VDIGKTPTADLEAVLGAGHVEFSGAANGNYRS
jgi:hypothetical protein